MELGGKLIILNNDTTSCGIPGQSITRTYGVRLPSATIHIHGGYVQPGAENESTNHPGASGQEY